MISPTDFEELLQQAAILDELAEADLRPSNLLTLLTYLRKTYSPTLAAALVETAQLRQKAQLKFPLAQSMFFTDEALQQATTYPVAQYHAHVLQKYPWVADLGCSIGGDALAMGQVTSVLGLDRDALRLRMARYNSQLYKAHAEFVQADFAQALPLRGIPAAFFDPARRSQDRRQFSIEGYSPPLAILHDWDLTAWLAKISPGVQLEELANFRAGIEFVSYEGDLKECLLHGGELAFEGFRANNLSQTLQSQGLAAPPLSAQPLRYLYEPDPAVIRSGLFGELCADLGLSAFRLDETIAYLTSDTWLENPWWRGWEVQAWMPFNLKKLRAELVKQGVGRVTVKKRGSPISPEDLIRMLKLKTEGREAIVFLTQLAGRPIALISYPRH